MTRAACTPKYPSIPRLEAATVQTQITVIVTPDMERRGVPLSEFKCALALAICEATGARRAIVGTEVAAVHMTVPRYGVPWPAPSGPVPYYSLCDDAIKYAADYDRGLRPATELGRPKVFTLKPATD